MDSDRIVPRPFDIGRDGGKGDLIWDAASLTYNDQTNRPFAWIQLGSNDVRTIYLPLSYLPRPYAEN